MREEGYAALNAKRIAERTGIKRQLVYYYFCDMDDLLVQLFHRIANRELDRLNAALVSDNPLRETWHVGINTFDQTLIAEFMALANRSEKVRGAVLDYADVARDIQIGALEKAIAVKPLPSVEIPAAAMAFIATWLALGIQREGALGITKGHREVQTLIETFLAKCDAVIE